MNVTDLLRLWRGRITRHVRSDTQLDALATRPLSSRFGLDRGTPIDRYYINKFLALHQDRVRGKCLEIGDDTYTKQFNQHVHESVILQAQGASNPRAITGDLTNASDLPDSEFDTFICTQTFNFIYDVDKAIEGAHRLLKPGGVMLATVGGISQISRYDMDRWGDYWRFTSASIQRLVEKHFATVDVRIYGNVGAAMSFLNGLAVEDLPTSSNLDVVDENYQMLLGVIAVK